MIKLINNFKILSDILCVFNGSLVSNHMLITSFWDFIGFYGFLINEFILNMNWIIYKVRVYRFNHGFE